MSDPNFRDPRLDPAPLRDDDVRSQRLNELESTNAMWGWIAGAVVLALVLLFVFTRSDSTDTTASNTVPSPPAATTGSAPSAPSTAQAPASRPATPPTTTGQGSSQ
jgi:hypothetical protein